MTDNFILFSKKKQAAKIVNLVLKFNEDFSADIKISTQDHPLFSLCFLMIKGLLIKDEKNLNTLCELISSLLEIIPSAQKKFDLADFQKFKNSTVLYGTSTAFRQYFLDLGISDSLCNYTLEKIHHYLTLFHDDPSRFLVTVEEENILIHVQSGENASRIKMMTCHASKGLEFDEVIVMGLLINESIESSRELVGENTASFALSEEMTGTTKMKSPGFLCEEMYKELKNFSESKRLFYVANTRAKKKLTFFDMHMNGQALRSGRKKHSWISALDLYKSHSSSGILKIENMSLNIIGSDLQTEFKKPLYFDNTLGLSPVGLETDFFYWISSELSVTKLVPLKECPRKFYFSQVIKIDEQNIWTPDPAETGMVVSSADRGTKLHAYIEHAIKHNFILPLEVQTIPEKDLLEKNIEQFKKLSSTYTFEAEVAIKFELFSFMISGVLDLILRPKKDEIFQIWDHKSGKDSLVKNENYFFQLKIYALAAYNLGWVEKSKPFESGKMRAKNSLLNAITSAPDR
jgi:hypothetical protein